MSLLKNLTLSGMDLLPQLKQSDYPNVPHWTRDDYTPDKSQVGRTSTLIETPIKSTEMPFLTDSKGVVVSAGLQKQVREAARTVFETIKKDHLRDPRANTAPSASWDGGATLAQRNMLRQELEAKFDFMRFCSNGWKSNQVAIKIYPQWNQNRTRADKHAEHATDGAPPPAKKARLARPRTPSELTTSVVSSTSPLYVIFESSEHHLILF